MTKLLTAAILRTIDSNSSDQEVVHIQLSSSRLAFYKRDPDDIENEEDADFEYYKAIVIIVSNAHAKKLPKVKDTYIEIIEAKTVGAPKKRTAR